MELVSKILDTLESYDKNEPTSPGLLLSKLPRGIDKGKYYVAVHRYRLPLGGNRVVVCSSKNKDLEVALASVAEMLPNAWAATTPVSILPN